MPDIPTFAEYLASLGRLTAHADPTAASPAAADIKAAAESRVALEEITTGTLAVWAGEHPAWVYALGLAVGLSQEKLKNTLKHHLGTSGWVNLARERSADLVMMLEEQFDLVRLIEAQRNRRYDFGDILIARVGTRQTATAAGASGRKVEDEIEAIATEPRPGLPDQDQVHRPQWPHSAMRPRHPSASSAEIAVGTSAECSATCTWRAGWTRWTPWTAASSSSTSQACCG